MTSGPGTAPEAWRYRGQRLGLPEDGPGSVASFGARLLALLVDWVLANLAAVAIVRDSAVWSPTSGAQWVPLAVFLVEVWLLTALTGASAGQRLLRLTVLRLDRRPVGLRAAAIRTALIALVIPPVVTDRDGRGLHDLAAGTVVVRGPSGR